MPTADELRAAFPQAPWVVRGVDGLHRFPWPHDRVYRAYMACRNEAVHCHNLSSWVYSWRHWPATGDDFTPGLCWLLDVWDRRAAQLGYDAAYLSWASGVYVGMEPAVPPEG